MIYKRGYVAWRNDVEFPGYGKRKGYDVWQHGYVYSLDLFEESYSRDKHAIFMHLGIIGANLQKTSKYYRGYLNESELG